MKSAVIKQMFDNSTLGLKTLIFYIISVTERSEMVFGSLCRI